MTFATLLNDVYRRLDKNPPASVGGTDTTIERIKRFMNDRYRELMRVDGVGADLRDETYIVTATPNNPRLVLPQVMTTISSVVDTTNRVKLSERTLAWIRNQDPSNPAMVTGTPWAYAVLNETGVIAQPSSPTATMEIVSNGADIRTFQLEGAAPNGSFSVLSAALTGTTPVALLGFTRLLRLSVQGVTSGTNQTVTVRETAPVPQTLMVLATGAIQPAAVQATMAQMAKLAWVLHLWPTPSAAISYSIDFARPTFELVNDFDEPALPEDFHTMLVWGACEEECLKMDDSRASYFRGKWDADLKAFRAYLHRARGQRWIPGRTGRGISTLGPFFPADNGGRW